jgi:hypothetical protein
MALDPHDAMRPDAESGAAPGVFRRPTDVPPRLDHIGDAEAVRALRHELSIRQGRAEASRRRKVRAVAGWITGRSRRRLLISLGAATIALAEQSDRLADRLMTQEEITQDVAATLGEELTRLRAEILHLRALTTSLDRPAHE